jgi:hypothetical protein
VQAAVTSLIHSLLPADVDGYRTLLPSQPGNKALTVRVRAVVAASRYAWDWDDTGATYTVVNYAPGSPARDRRRRWR